ncbi:RNA-directed DNA polymerase [Vibrio parahaemolyticus]|nr:RNA-directed DNA polymerase [Vibrio parahaemolyticus]EKL5296865.1 RNA-directed DNA polymerase [Vibrio parahaemolyticus]ELA7176884.1 RNA-directed DNA polymerase [Vibrio parahaemolyticus]ELA7459368.1 RNA-directed DNA polymerase [Vibrio parahaemolyticus]ELA7483330.1 RNA-directed DNA polymerase [Vibrio parahaemolyticus]
MTLLETLLARGYFPKEALPAFTTEHYAKAIADNYDTLPNLFRNNKFISTCGIHNVSRKGTLRRKLGIPNPVSYFRLADVITENWYDIDECVRKSHLSLTTPTSSASGERAFDRKYPLSELPELHAHLRSRYKYILKTDISRFYHSIYTHSVAWTYHTKATAKRNRSYSLFGNLVDKCLQDSQDGQTIGIPIGPDSSLVIAESILARIDEQLKDRGIDSGLRYIDDYYLGFHPLGEAESALTVMQELLNEYELALNPLKTEIIQLPDEFEPLPISEMRSFSFRSTEGGQKSDLIHYFNLAFRAAREMPTESILKYAVSRVYEIDVTENNYPIFESFILQCATADSSTLRFVANQLIKYKRKGYELSVAKVSQVLRQLALAESSLGHGNEVAYCLWLHLVLNIDVPEDVTKSIVTMRDSFVAILLCDCFDKGLMPYTPDFAKYENLMTKDELLGDMWLFVYEALSRKWFKPVARQNPVKQNECFNFLLRTDVLFYDDSISSTVMAESPFEIELVNGGFSG